MSQNHESCLRFSLEESVWFQKGQEVAELVSISLDPNISIQENEQYVTIKGALELTGEFRRFEDDAVEEEDIFSAPKFVHRVEEREGGILEFFHRFPVDITIPNNRIQSVDDINIEVESFDYLFQERSCMKLTADLTITGLYGDQQHRPSYETAQERTVADEGEVATELEVEFEYEAELEPVHVAEERQPDSEEEEFVEVEVVDASDESPVTDDLYEPFQVEARRAPENTVEVSAVVIDEAPQVSVNEVSEPEVFFQASRKEVQKEQVEVVEEVEVEEATETPSLEMVPEPAPEPVVSPAVENVPQQTAKPVKQEVEAEESSSSPVKPVKKKKSSKKGMSLTEFFARKEETDELVKLRVAIVQHGETLEGLASRYSVPVQQLLKVNHLDLQQDIYEGQVLYIPIAVAHR